jgi:hypothetical protein
MSASTARAGFFVAQWSAQSSAQWAEHGAETPNLAEIWLRSTGGFRNDWFGKLVCQRKLDEIEINGLDD